MLPTNRSNKHVTYGEKRWGFLISSARRFLQLLIDYRRRSSKTNHKGVPSALWSVLLLVVSVEFCLSQATFTLSWQQVKGWRQMDSDPTQHLDLAAETAPAPPAAAPAPVSPAAPAAVAPAATSAAPAVQTSSPKAILDNCLSDVAKKEYEIPINPPSCDTELVFDRGESRRGRMGSDEAPQRRIRRTTLARDQVSMPLNQQDQVMEEVRSRYKDDLTRCDQVTDYLRCQGDYLVALDAEMESCVERIKKDTCKNIPQNHLQEADKRIRNLCEKAFRVYYKKSVAPAAKMAMGFPSSSQCYSEGINLHGSLLEQGLDQEAKDFQRMALSSMREASEKVKEETMIALSEDPWFRTSGASLVQMQELALRAQRAYEQNEKDPKNYSSTAAQLRANIEAVVPDKSEQRTLLAGLQNGSTSAYNMIHDPAARQDIIEGGQGNQNPLYGRGAMSARGSLQPTQLGPPSARTGVGSRSNLAPQMTAAANRATMSQPPGSAFAAYGYGQVPWATGNPSSSYYGYPMSYSNFPSSFPTTTNSSLYCSNPIYCNIQSPWSSIPGANNYNYMTNFWNYGNGVRSSYYPYSPLGNMFPPTSYQGPSYPGIQSRSQSLIPQARTSLNR